MKIIEGSSVQGVSERSFELEIAGERVPGVLWTPAGEKNRTALGFARPRWRAEQA